MPKCQDYRKEENIVNTGPLPWLWGGPMARLVCHFIPVFKTAPGASLGPFRVRLGARLPISSALIY